MLEKERHGKSKTHTIVVEPTMVVMTPYVFADFSHHIWQMCENYASQKAAILPRYYLSCVSIELGLKAAILALDCNEEAKSLIKKIGHDLMRLNNTFEEKWGNPIMSSEDLIVIGKINKYYKSKGLEYFTPDVLYSMAHGYKNFPDLAQLRSISRNVDEFIVNNEFFIDGKTTHKPDRGILVFI